MLKAIRFIFYTEWVLLLRRSREWLYPLGFFLIVISLFPLAFTPDPIFLQKFIPGCVWIAALLASLLAVENVFFTDIEEGNIEQLLLSQLPLSLLILIKLLVQWLITQLPLIILTPLIGIIFHLPITAILYLCISLLLGTPVLTLIGCFGVALTIGLRQQGVLLGLLILPLVIPILIFGVSIVQQAQTHGSLAAPLAFLAGLSIFAITLLPFTIAATLRVSLDD